MITIESYISGFSETFEKHKEWLPWHITSKLTIILEEMIAQLGSDFHIENGIAVHKSAVVEGGAVLKAPVIISQKCFVASKSYLRGGVYLGESSIIGPGCDIKTSIFMENAVAAHLNFIGDSIIGNDVNFEAGSVTANHYNERVWNEITVIQDGNRIQTGSTRFGSLIGDHGRIGANAVLSPGTLLQPNTVVDRLQLVDQLKSWMR